MIQPIRLVDEPRGFSIRLDPLDWKDFPSTIHLEGNFRLVHQKLGHYKQTGAASQQPYMLLAIISCEPFGLAFGLSCLTRFLYHNMSHDENVPHHSKLLQDLPAQIWVDYIYIYIFLYHSKQ